jgi:transcriptional regulator with XRE-family HTH domain
MIKNEREYRITKAQAEKFERALARFAQPAGVDGEIHPLLRKAQEDALRSQLADLRTELEEYEALRAGRRAVPDLRSFTDLPQQLIRRRIAAGLSQKDLANRLGLKEQQVQRYEATDYASASFTRLVEVIRALEMEPAPDLVSAVASGISFPVLLKRLDGLGFDREFVTSRLIPGRIVAQLEDDGSDHAHQPQLVHQAAEYAGRVLDLPASELLGQAPPQLGTAAALSGVRFKVAAHANERRLIAYTVYAHYLALLLLEATRHLPRKPIPIEPDQVREGILASYGSVTLEPVLRYIWDLGVPVLPLRDRGAFHGACWRAGGRNVIVLKQRTRSAARWMFDGLHEMRHAGQEPERDEFSLVESDEEETARWQQPDEQVASQFAGNVVLAGRAEELALRCARTAGMDVRRLKTVVPQVATAAGVPLDGLANYMAFRLALEGHNWWPTATTLQASDTDPWAIARDVLLERADLGQLNEVDRELLSQALAEGEG